MSHIAISPISAAIAMVVIANPETGDHEHLSFEAFSTAHQNMGSSIQAKKPRQENAEKKYAARGEVMLVLKADGSIVVAKAAAGCSIQTKADIVERNEYKFDPAVLEAVAKACQITIDNQEVIKQVLFNKGGVVVKKNMNL